jgi:hypothetical protein
MGLSLPVLHQNKILDLEANGNDAGGNAQKLKEFFSFKFN